MVAKQEK